MWKIIIATIILGLIALLVALSLAGMFDQPEFTERSVGPYTLVFKKIDGEYQQTGLFIESMKTWLSQQGINSQMSFAMFFDNPQKTESKNLRFIAGHILSDKDADKLDVVSKQYLVKIFPRQKCLVGIFPYRSPLSILFGLMKVYPELELLREEKGYANHPIMEIYDKQEKQTVYLQPIEPGVDLMEEYFLFEENTKETPASPASVSPTCE